MGRSRKDSSPQKRKIKDANRPKRSTSAYFYFLHDCREKAKETGAPTAKIGDFTKECSVKWNALTEVDKKPFLARAQTDKERYQKEMEAYTGKIKDVNKPKKPASSYFCFLAEFRIDMKGKNVDHKQMLSLAGEKWRGLNDGDKQKYIELAAIEHKKYEIAMEEYRRTGGKMAKGVNGVAIAPPVVVDEEEEDEEEDDEEEGEED
ncbi:high mobility group protein B3-like [Gigantopelta aegis]|uniref:high mobility group protein B3-like n=1 Tax=Gigantopelta aegis TaxID=1735272 RepID=UPI001B88764F|nr:high mobility group protein B3-like [Gigantopelta aegis]